MKEEKRQTEIARYREWIKESDARIAEYELTDQRKWESECILNRKLHDTLVSLELNLFD